MLIKQTAFWITTLILTSMLITACASSGTAATPTQDAQAVYTQAAQAVQSELTQSAALTPSATVQPTDTHTMPVIPTLAVTAMPPATQTPATPVATLTNTVPAGSASLDQATLVTQSVADKTTYGPGESFKVTWTLKNTGKSTWTTLYALKWYSGLQGDNLKVANTVNLANPVKPDESIDISVSFVSPKDISIARTVWYLQDTMTGANILKLTLEIEVANVPTATLTVTTAVTSTTAVTAATLTPTAASNTPTVTPTK